MAGRGGYQAPSNPAAASGPGALSQRTDGGPTQAARYMPGLGYGKGGENFSNQTQAPLAGNPIEAPAGSTADMASLQPVALSAPTQRPEEPGTAGINRGAGGGSELMMDMPRFKPSIQSTLEKAAMFDDSGEAELILNQFFSRG